MVKYNQTKVYCKCGCGGLVKCEGREYVLGHSPKAHFKKGNKIRNTGRTRFKKGNQSPKKNKTFEEMYGIEEAQRLKEISSKNMKKTYKEGKIMGGKKGRIPWNKGMSGKYIRLSTRGENHWNWKEGKYSVEESLRLKSAWIIWREKVFSRDNYTCQNQNCQYCNNKIGGVELHPHHKKPASLYPELIFDVDNGITYCKEYHVKGGLHKGIKRKNE